MKKYVLKITTYLILFYIFLCMYPVHNACSNPCISITADAAVLLDARTGQVLYSKNSHQARPPASTTKVATALMALQIGNLDNVITVSKKAANVGESSIHLIEGEELTLKQLLTGALIKSGNDACAAIAEGLSGTEKMYMQLVNNRVNLLGANDTVFINSNGLPIANHLSSAYDLALITRYAFLNSTFREIVKTPFTKINRQKNWMYSIKNTNKLLWIYSNANGVKTGTTNKAGSCLIASAERDNKFLISVVLHSDSRYEDSIKLMEYGFNNFEEKEIIKSGEKIKEIKVSGSNGKTLEASAASSKVFLSSQNTLTNFKTKCIIKDDIKVPVQSGDIIGIVKIFYREKPVGYVNLVARNSVQTEYKGLKITRYIKNLFPW
ncbi:MAG: D-alanyl-D-alanine carboxypeptidase [Clostridiales bacterium]|nr:D-alanyl-D-alanine carboxypeptidase [Clostridiales bacterium]MCF8022190.1 D-alanyl-D-alanine carboxypeptidase [Clostridiales bacterium]